MKRIIPIVLLLCLLFAAMSINVYAAEPNQPEVSANGGMVTFEIMTEGDTQAGVPIADGFSIPEPVIPCPIQGGVRILVTDIAGTPLPGAVFGLYDTGNQLIEELVTDENGITESGSLDGGDYYLSELSAPVGFLPVYETIPFSITEHGEVVCKTIVNSRGYGILRITVSGNEGEPVPGAVFALYHADTNDMVTKLTTDDTGTAIFEPLTGRYDLIQTQTAEGYLLPESGFSFVLAEHGETVELAVQNEKGAPAVSTGTIRLVKRDESTGALLPGAVFGIYDAATDKKIAEMTTGSDGMATTGQLPGGNYYLMELTAPAGYTLSTEKTAVRVAAGEMAEVTVTNEPEKAEPTGVLLVTKVDKNTEERLSGAVFGIYNTATNEKITEITTGSDGMVSYELTAESYYLRELKAPDGYVLSADKVPFTVKSGETTELTVTNMPEKTENTGTLLIIKKAEKTGKPLSGAVFGVYDASTDEKVAEITTGGDGMVSYELPAGDYYLRELKAPDGYALEKAKILFSIKSEVTVKIEVTNMLADINPVTGGAARTISVPKTGGASPALNYVLAALCMSISIICGLMLCRRYRNSLRRN